MEKGETRIEGKDYSFLAAIEDPKLVLVTMAELGKLDVYFLAKYILGMRDLETSTRIHWDICGILDNDPMRYLFLMFRGAFKTSLIVAKTIQWLIRDKNSRIGIGSDIKDRAESVTKDIRDTIAGNTLLKSLYRDIFYERPGNESSLFRADAFNVKQDSPGLIGGGFKPPSVMAFGLDPLPTGKHFTHVIFDDMENEQNQDNPELNAKLFRNLSLFFPIPNPRAPVYIFGTIYSGCGPHTIYQKRWPTYKYPILDKRGDPTFPSRFSLEVVEKIRQDVDTGTWEGQYLLISPTKRENLFYPFSLSPLNRCTLVGNEIHYGNSKVKLSEVKIYITIDPSGGVGQADIRPGLRADMVGQCIVAVTTCGGVPRWLILDLRQEYLNDIEFVERLFQLDALYQPTIIAIERTPHLQSIIHQAMSVRGIALPLHELKPANRKKADRIRALALLLPIIYFNDTLDIEVMIRGWHTETELHDDAIDALAYLIDIAAAPTREELGVLRRLEAGREEKERLQEMPHYEAQEWKALLARFAPKGDGMAREWEDALEALYDN